MKTKCMQFMLHNKNILFLLLGVACLLLLPLIAMQITDRLEWDLADFVIAGALLFGTGLAYELLTRKAGGFAYRAAVGAALATALFLFWANLAVGVFGSEDNPANWMVLGVLAVLITGALLARFRAHGMVWALLATALAQGIVTGLALITEESLDVADILKVNGFFIALWLGSAWLFRRANAAQNQRLA